MDVTRIFAGLNDEQRRAVEAVRGPVCILAGAGSGKTTTITRRVAHQVASGTFGASEILAVTFTDKAAGEMRARLADLGVTGVRASTFHSAALGQLRAFAPEPPERILASKALMLRYIANSLPTPYRFRPAADLATEIEWAKNRRVSPDRYLASLGTHMPPIPEPLMLRVYREYERRKEREGYVDFEDLLEHAVRLLGETSEALERVRARYRAFTVDEYQDVNVLQQTLLDLWLGERDDVCAVGDDYQSIYAFTGASPEYLLTMPQRYPHALVVKLEANYRSAPEVLALANELVPRLGGAEKRLRATRPSAAPPELRSFGDTDEETQFVIERARAFHDAGVAYEEIALLYRTNARSADFEEAFTEAGIPFQGAALLAREGARQVLKVLRGSQTHAVATEVSRAARAQGLLERLPDRLGEREVTRQNDLARLVRLAEEFDDGSRTVADFLEHLQARFGQGGEGRGVHFLTYHRAKGLEFDAVLLPRLVERELPWKLARTAAAFAEERRLLYVGMTRARRHLVLTWAGKPSRFLAELGVETRPRKPLPEELPPEFAALKAWRRERAAADGIPAYVVFHDTTLAEIASRNPRTAEELGRVSGVGPTKLERYAAEVLSVLSAR